VPVSQGHYKRPYPRHFDPQKCGRCKNKVATVYVHAMRQSRSGNMRPFIMGAYCHDCADLAIADAKQRQLLRPRRA